MKIIITLSELRQAVLNLAKEYNEEYVCVKIEMSSDEKIIISGYINGFRQWFEATNISDLIRKMRESKGEKTYSPHDVTDAEVELTTTE